MLLHPPIHPHPSLCSHLLASMSVKSDCDWELVPVLTKAYLNNPRMRWDLALDINIMLLCFTRYTVFFFFSLRVFLTSYWSLKFRKSYYLLHCAIFILLVHLYYSGLLTTSFFWLFLFIYKLTWKYPSSLKTCFLWPTYVPGLKEGVVLPNEMQDHSVKFEFWLNKINLKFKYVSVISWIYV